MQNYYNRIKNKKSNRKADMKNTALKIYVNQSYTNFISQTLFPLKILST